MEKLDKFEGYILPFTLKWEGGYSDDKDDPGGETKYGIEELTFKEAKKRGIISVGSVRELTKEDATKIYRKLYWEPIKGDDLPLWAGMLVFDTAVNQGQKWGVLYLQKALNWLCDETGGKVPKSKVTEDGVIGYETIAAVRYVNAGSLQKDIDECIRAYCVNRELRYLEIIMNAPKLQKFAKGWFMRTCDLQDYAKTLKGW